MDAVRGMALAQGRTAFGDAAMARSGLTRFLTASRTMRNAYGAAKVIAFVLLGTLTVLSVDDGWNGGMPPARVQVLERAAACSVLLAVALCLLRGAPVLVDAREYLSPRSPETSTPG